MRLAIILALILSGCAITRSPASDAAAADTASTGVAMALGGLEANPIGLLTIPVKLALLQHVETLPADEKQAAQTTMAAVWGGAALNNICVGLVLLSGGVASLPCLIAGAGYGVISYTTDKANQMQAQFLALCLDARKDAPTMRCFYQGVEV